MLKNIRIYLYMYIYIYIFALENNKLSLNFYKYAD